MSDASSSSQANSSKSKNAGRPARKRRIGEMLVQAGLVTAAQVQEALDLQKKKGGKTVENLIHIGYLATNDFAEFLVSQPGVAGFDMSQYDIPKETYSLVSREFAEKHELFPIDKLGKLLTVGMAFPLDLKTIEELSNITGLKVKALLCSPQDIRDAIERYYAEPEDHQEEFIAVQDMFGRLKISTRLKNVSSLILKINVLPALPQTVQKVQEAIEDPDVYMDEVAETIAQDPAVSASLLRLVNSAAFGKVQSVDNIPMAVKLLGLKETHMAVLSSSVINMMEKSQHFDYKTFWREAKFAAHAAKAIAAGHGVASKAGVFSAGLLHDLGCFAFSEVAPGRYSKIDSNLRGEELIKAEEEVFGIAHAEAGHTLASHWGLPEEISEPIRFHHAPQLAITHQTDVAIVALSSILGEAYAHDVAVDEPHIAEHANILALLNLDAQAVLEVYANTSSHLNAEPS